MKRDTIREVKRVVAPSSEPKSLEAPVDRFAKTRLGNRKRLDLVAL